MSTRDRRSAAVQAVDRARRLIRRTAIDVAIEGGAQVVSRPAWPGAESQIQDVEPMAGFRAARELEAAARFHARRYLRAAREAGFTWTGLGTAALDPGMRRESERAGGSAAELAYEYAVGRDGHPPSYYEAAFVWTCRSCDKLISDRGPFDGPAASQPGHAEGCARLAHAEADRDADWEAAD